MKKVKAPRIRLLNRISLFLIAFAAALLLQMGISNYQTVYILEPQEERTRDIQAISQFLNDVESCMQVLEDFRWDYGDTESLTAAVRFLQRSSATYLDLIDTELENIGEEQYLLANAAKTTYGTFSLTVDQILELLQAGETDAAAALYYEKAGPCGGYLRQYVQQLLEQVIMDGQSTYLRLARRNEDLKKLQSVTMIICVVLGALAVISLFALMKLVKEMSQASQAISRGELDTPDVDESLDDETGYMAKTFNEMKRSMKRQVELLNEKNEMERTLHKKETEALEWQNLMEREKHQQLRSQINPHFLFNTLNVIMYTAQHENAPETYSLLGSLSKLFRYALASNEVQVPLSREIHIVNEFYALYHARFAERMKMVWDVSPEVDLTETLVPSFILQPLVENSFRHGIGPKEEGGTVSIRIWQEREVLYIRVTDDGVGMTEEVLRGVRENMRKLPENTGEHIGVYNVAARLRLCGEGYGMEITSREGEGTVAALRLPLTMQQEEEGGTYD